MERWSLNLQAARKALTSLDEVLSIPNPSAIERDASIQRFEYCYEIVWKTAKHWLLSKEGVDAGSPKSVIRSSREVGLLSDSEASIALKMVDDRNLTVHTYNEALAAAIHSRLPGYYQLLEIWLSRMNET